jgi:hypothetical protein
MDCFASLAMTIDGHQAMTNASNDVIIAAGEGRLDVAG